MLRVKLKIKKNCKVQISDSSIILSSYKQFATMESILYLSTALFHPLIKCVTFFITLQQLSQ